MRRFATWGLALLVVFVAAPATAGHELDYLVRYTAGAEPAEELPLIVAVHGLGDRPERFGVWLESLPVKARVALPRAPEPWHDGYAWFPYAKAGLPAVWSLAGLEVAAERLAALIDELRLRFPTRGEPILVGFSQGGMLAFVVAVNHPESVGLAIPIAGWLPMALWPKAPAGAAAPRVRAFHGEADSMLPLAGTRPGVARLKRLGYDVVLTTYANVEHRLPPQMRRDIFRVLAR